MPTYDYQCKLCGHRLELFQSMKEAPKRKCPECSKNGLERLIGPGAGFIFKGSGFYLTDYRSESYKQGEQAASSSTSSGDSSSGASAGPSGPAKPPSPAPSDGSPKAKDSASGGPKGSDPTPGARANKGKKPTS